MSGKVKGRTLGVVVGIVGDKPMTQTEFIVHLVKKNGFKLIAPWTLLYKDKKDVIVVSIRENVVIITSDGPQVVPMWQIRPLYEGPDKFFWDEVLQEVLGFF